VFYYLTQLELFVAFSKVNNKIVKLNMAANLKNGGLIIETRGGNSNFDVIL